MKRWIPLLLLFFSTHALCLPASKEKEKKKEPNPPQTQTQPQTEVAVTNEVILQGTYSGIREALVQIVSSKQDWEALWKRHTSLLVPQPPLPVVDFDSQAVVAVFDGEKRTSGYAIRVKNVTAEGKDLVITYHVSEPTANSFNLQVLTQPFVLLRVQKPPGTIRLVKK